MERDGQDLFSEAYWQQRAENARRIAQMLDRAQAREMMLDVARDYERLARRAAASPTGRSLLAEEPDSYGKGF